MTKGIAIWNNTIAINNNMSKIRKSVANTHPTIITKSAITIIKHKNENKHLISLCWSYYKYNNKILNLSTTNYKFCYQCYNKNDRYESYKTFHITSISTMLSVFISKRLAISFLLIGFSDSIICVLCHTHPNSAGEVYITLYRAISNPPNVFKFHKK